jgi:hypothetical protein
MFYLLVYLIPVWSRSLCGRSSRRLSVQFDLAMKLFIAAVKSFIRISSVTLFPLIIQVVGLMAQSSK